MLAQIHNELVSLRCSDGVLVINVNAATGTARQQYEFQQIVFLKQLTISACIPASGFRPFVQVTKLNAKDGSLKRIQPAVYSDKVIVIFAPGAMRAERAND